MCALTPNSNALGCLQQLNVAGDHLCAVVHGSDIKSKLANTESWVEEEKKKSG